VETIQVQLGDRSYPIHIGSGVLADRGLLERCIEAEQVLVVSNEVVAPLYLERIEQALATRRLRTAVLPDGERHKTIETFSRLIDELIESGFHRDACVVALGGGVRFAGKLQHQRRRDHHQ
jgi:3-dehydroquinate synthase